MMILTAYLLFTKENERKLTVNIFAQKTINIGYNK